MARETYIIDRKTKKLINKADYVPPETSRIVVIKDIDPYRAAAADKQSGKRPVIGGRRQHREFLQRNGYVELGNDGARNRTPGDTSTRQERVDAIKRAMGE